MLSHTFKKMFIARWTWTTILIIIFSITIASFELFLTLTEGLTEDYQSLTKYNLGFVIMYGGKSATITKSNPFKELNEDIIIDYPFNDELVSKISSNDMIRVSPDIFASPFTGPRSEKILAPSSASVAPRFGASMVI